MAMREAKILKELYVVIGTRRPPSTIAAAAAAAAAAATPATPPPPRHPRPRHLLRTLPRRSENGAHPNIVQLYASASSSTCSYTAMELVGTCRIGSTYVLPRPARAPRAGIWTNEPPRHQPTDRPPPPLSLRLRLLSPSASASTSASASASSLPPPPPPDPRRYSRPVALRHDEERGRLGPAIHQGGGEAARERAPLHPRAGHHPS